MVRKGRPPHPNRNKIRKALRNPKISLDEICTKYAVSKRTVYYIAEQHNIDMPLRTEIRQKMEKRKELRRQIQELNTEVAFDIQEFWKNFEEVT